VTGAEQETNLELMPRAVRDKLDRVRIKLHLKEWQALTLAERMRLRDLPCEDDADAKHYAAEVDALARRLTGHPAERVRDS
jgi:nitrate reductase-associated protein